MTDDNNFSASDILAHLINKFKQHRQRLEQRDWAILPEPPDIPDFQQRKYLSWQPAYHQVAEKPLSLPELRTLLPEKITAYINSKEPGTSALLVNVGAGYGKTHAAVMVAQALARAGQRVLWVSPRYENFRDIERMPHYDPDLWYLWRAMAAQNPGAVDPNECMCKLWRYQATWTAKGYPAGQLCRWLCAANGYIKQCPFRQQQYRTEPIVCARHQHLTTGLPLGGFDVVFVDEMPVQAFIQRRRIPLDQLVMDGMTGLMVAMFRKMQHLAQSGHVLDGKALMDEIGEFIPDIAAGLEHLQDHKLLIPFITSPQQVDTVGYNFLLDFMTLATEEHKAWEAGWQEWNSRLELRESGLYLLSRRNEWAELPNKMVIMDATAESSIYELILPERHLLLYRPTLQRVGRVYQIINRLYGLDTLKPNDEDKTIPPQLIEAALTVDMLTERNRGKRVGIITHKGIIEPLKGLLPDPKYRFVHFYNQRGSNALQDVDILFVLGAPAPNMFSIVHTATALQKELGWFGEDIFSHEWRPYDITPEAAELAKKPGMQPTRLVNGYWQNRSLSAVLFQGREAEMIQSVHRSRANIRYVIVYILSSVPLPGLFLDRIYEHPPLDWSVMLPARSGEKEYTLHWQNVVKLQPLLNGEQPRLTIDDLAECCNVAPRYVQYTGKWLHIIPQYRKDWELVKHNKEWLLVKKEEISNG